MRVTGDWLTAPATQAVFAALNRDGFRARAVGGTVRNALLGVPATDIDIATTAPPDDVAHLAQAAGMSVHPTGIAHGTLTIVSQHQTFEVTTLRTDVTTDGRRATVAFTTDWETDARRRDFTINALYCDADGTLFDPLNTYPDLQARKIRFIDDPHARIREDYLRILRFFRFFATYGAGPIDTPGLEACTALKSGIAALSGERIQAEILRLLVANKALEAVSLMHDTTILGATLPTQTNIPLLARLTSIEDANDIAPDALLRLGALAISQTGDANAITKRLKLSNVQSHRLKTIEKLMAALSTNEKALRDETELARLQILYREGATRYKDRCLLQWANSNDAANDPAHRTAYSFADGVTPPEMPFTGADLIAKGLEPGPHIGRTLSRFETWWINAGFPDEPTVLETKLTEFANSDGPDKAHD